MVGWLIKEQEFRLKEQGPGKGNSHSPSTRELARFHTLHRKRKTKTMKNRRGTSLGRGGIELVQAVINALQLRLDLELLILIGIRHGVVQRICLLLQLGNFIGRFQHSLQSSDVVTGGILGIQEVNVQAIRDGDSASGNGLHDRGLARTVGTDETIPVSIVDDQIGLLNQVLSMKGNRNSTNVDIARVGVQSALLGLVRNNNVVFGQLLESLLTFGVDVALDVQSVQCIGNVVAIFVLLLVRLLVFLLTLSLAGLALGFLLLFTLLLGKGLLLLLAQFLFIEFILYDVVIVGSSNKMSNTHDEKRIPTC